MSFVECFVDSFSTFSERVNGISFFGKNSIEVLSFEIIKKNSDIEFIVEIPSPVGNLMYYCKAKSKARVSDSDLSNAYVKGQSKKLPVLFLSYGRDANAEEGRAGFFAPVGAERA